jgi:hypothetical protein
MRRRAGSVMGWWKPFTKPRSCCAQRPPKTYPCSSPSAAPLRYVTGEARRRTSPRRWPPPLRCGSYPFSASAWQVQPRSPSGLGRAPTATRAWSATLRPQSAAAAFKASAAALPLVGIRVEHWANGRPQGVVAAKAMLGQDAVDLRPSYFYTDQFDLSMEYTGDLGPAGYDRVIFRRHADSPQVIVFWLYEQRVQAGMNINILDVAVDIERLVQSARLINVDDLADPDIPLASLF